MQIIGLTYVTRLNLAKCKSGHATYQLLLLHFTGLTLFVRVCSLWYHLVSQDHTLPLISLVIMSLRTNSNYDFINSTCFAFLVSQLLSSVECA